MVKYFILIFLSGIIFYSCNKETEITGPQSGVSAYSKINTVESGSVKFEVWSATSSGFVYGYNAIGFKVFVNGNEKSDGFVKFKPLMIHFPGQLGHSCPISQAFYYNNSEKLFTGYACFSMITDTNTSGKWIGYYNYNDTFLADSIPFSVALSSNQLIEWDDIIGSNSYVLTLLSPSAPKTGLNDIQCLLHKYIGNNLYSEVDSAEMIIKPWMPSYGQGSGNNINPAGIGNGKYKGVVNLTRQGLWYVYDTIKINNTVITKSSPPKFIFDIQ